MGSLSKTLAHGLRAGFIVAPAELIRELRALRRLILRYVPTNKAHLAGLCIAQEYHDAFIRKLNMTYRERRTLLTTALGRHMPDYQIAARTSDQGRRFAGRETLMQSIRPNAAKPEACKKIGARFSSAGRASRPNRFFEWAIRQFLAF